MAPLIRAPRGTSLRCRGWKQEAALRMLMNNLDPDVGERPADLVVYGGTGRRRATGRRTMPSCGNWNRSATTRRCWCSRAVPSAFSALTKRRRVLIANANLVGHWSNWEQFRALEKLGLIMYGQMTAGSWIYIGSQGILQGTYETFAAAARKHFGGSLAGRLVVTGGLGGMGGAQPLAATMNGAVFLGIDVDPARIRKRIETGYCDRMTDNLDEALAILREATPRPAEIRRPGGQLRRRLPELARRGVGPGYTHRSDQRPRSFERLHPRGYTVDGARRTARARSAAISGRSLDSIAAHVRAMLDLQHTGAVTFDYGNNIRVRRRAGGVTDAFKIPGFVPEYIRPLFCEGRGPFRWVALSGEPRISPHRPAICSDVPANHTLTRWISLAREGAFSGPARAHLLAGLWRARKIRRWK